MRGKPAAVGAIAAGCLLCVGATLDWTGVAYSSDVDRRLAFAAGVAVVLIGILALVWRGRALGLAVLPAAVGLNMGVVNARDVSDHAHEYARYPDASVGTGLYLVLIGAAVALSCGLLALLPRGIADRRRPPP